MRRTWTSLSCVLLAAAGCGKIKNTVDADHGDDDAPTIDASTVGEITVVTHSRTAPGVVAAIDVVAVNPDGEVITALTDGSGEATLEIHAGASVTAIYRALDGGTLFTYAGVEPGDELVFGADVQPEPSIVGSMTAAFPGAGASSYQIFHACGEESGNVELLTATMTQSNDCNLATQDVLFYALNGAGEVQNWGEVEAAPWINNGTVTLGSWQAATTFTATINGLPAEVVQAGLQAQVISNHPSVDGFYVYDTGAPTAGSFSFARSWGGGGDEILGLAIAETETSAQYLSRRIPDNSTQFVVNDMIGVPWMGAVTVDVAAREVTFDLDGDQPHDNVTIAIDYTRVAPDGGFERFAWQLVVPPGSDGANTVELPALPGAFARFIPAATDTVQAGGTVYDFDTAASYADVRARPEWLVSAGFGTFVQALLFEESRLSMSGLLRAARDDRQFGPWSLDELRSHR